MNSKLQNSAKNAPKVAIFRLKIEKRWTPHPPRRLRRLDTRVCGAWPCPPPFANPGSATE